MNDIHNNSHPHRDITIDLIRSSLATCADSVSLLLYRHFIKRPSQLKSWKVVGHSQAAESLDSADEAEEFQAVGMRCRESLIAMVRAIAQPAMVPKGTEEQRLLQLFRGPN